MFKTRRRRVWLSPGALLLLVFVALMSVACSGPDTPDGAIVGTPVDNVTVGELMSPASQGFKIVYRYNESPSIENSLAVWQRGGGFERFDFARGRVVGEFSESRIGDMVTRFVDGVSCVWFRRAPSAANPAPERTVEISCDKGTDTSGAIGFLTSFDRRHVVSTFPPRAMLGKDAPCYAVGTETPADIVCVDPDSRVPLFVAAKLGLLGNDRFSIEAISVAAPDPSFLAGTAIPDLRAARDRPITVDEFRLPAELLEIE